MSNQMYEIRLVDIVNMTGAEVYFEITQGTNSVRRCRVLPGEVTQIEEGYTKPIPVAEGRMPRPSILQQIAPGMKRLDEVNRVELAALRAQNAPQEYVAAQDDAPPVEPVRRGPGRPPKAPQV